MTHKEAVAEMKVLAAGWGKERSWSLTYKISSYSKEIEIYGYIEDAGVKGLGHARAATTYAGAIKNVKEMLGLIFEEIDDPPEDEI